MKIKDYTINEDNFRCWKFKECNSLDEYLMKYVNTGDIDLDSYQYVYDESEDWLKDKWTTEDVQRAFYAGIILANLRLKEKIINTILENEED